MTNINLLKNKYALLFLVYIVALTLFAVFSYKIIFHDGWEYISLTKKFAGFMNYNIFTVHSLVYPFFLSFFVKYLPSILTMKLVNLSWIILIGFLFYRMGLNKTAFLIWVFSPIVWVRSLAISPILPASFFLLVAYMTIKKWQDNKKSIYFIISALALGLTAAFYDLSVVFAVLFVLTFLYDQKFKNVIFYSLLVFLSFSVRLILDASLFDLSIADKLVPFPFYSLIRFWGALLVIHLGLHPMIPVSKLSFSSFHYLYFLFIISPLLFYLLKINYKENKKEIVFLALSTVLLLIQGAEYYYYLLLAPIAILLLSKVFKKRELLLHIAISSFIIFIMTNSYLIPDRQEIEKRNLIIDDLKMVVNDYSFDAVIFDTETLASLYMWDKNLPFVIPREERDKILQNDYYYTNYTFEVESKIDTQKVLEFKAGLKTNIKKGRDYDRLPWLLEKGEEVPEGYKLTKCYKLLCVYQKQ